MPATWQAWLILAAYIVVVWFLAAQIDPAWTNSEVTVNFIIPFCIIVASFILVCYKFGEKPRWQWGDKAKD
jgi:hypothetical protein